MEERRLLAADFFVNTTVDTLDANPGDGLALDADGNTSLRAAIMEANALAGHQTIMLPAGEFVLTRAGHDEDASRTGDLDVLDHLTILGAGCDVTILDADGLDRYFEIIGNGGVPHLRELEFHLSHLAVVNGNATDHGDLGQGGAIRVYKGNTLFDDVAFRNNQAREGGGLAVEQGEATAKASIFAGNHAVELGGAVWSRTIFATESSTFEDNTALHGGAIAQEGGQTTIDASLFLSNAATDLGGAIYNIGESPKLTIRDSRFEQNEARAGGALHDAGSTVHASAGFNSITDEPMTSIVGTEFVGNIASEDGGAFHNFMRSATSLFDPTQTMVDVRFEGNIAGRNGGAIYNDGLLRLEIEQAVFRENMADGSGGAIYGAIASRPRRDAEDFTVSIVSHWRVSVIDSVFESNTAQLDGGAIFDVNTRLNVSGTSFVGNTAEHRGGAFYLEGTALDLGTSTLSGNTAVAGAGIFNNSSATLGIYAAAEVHASTITNNVAEDFGGGVVNFGGLLILRNTIVAGNEAGQTAPDLSGSIGSRGYNLIGNVGDALGLRPGRNHDLVGTPDAPIDPLLAPLSTGKDTLPVHVPLPGSPVIDTGVDDDAATDQRGLPRNVDNPETANSNDTDGTDIGAAERQSSDVDFVVNTTADTLDANPGDGLALDADGNTSLRAAIMEANALAGHQTIMLPSGEFMLTRTGRGEDSARTGDLDILDDLTIIGAGRDVTILDADRLDRLFHVQADAAFELMEVMLQHGEAQDDGDSAGLGGAILVSSGILNLHDSTVKNNLAKNGGGVGAEVDGRLEIRNTLFVENTALRSGGALFSHGITLIESSAFLQNEAGEDGGAIVGDIPLFCLCDAVFEIDDSQFNDNTADRNGGAIANLQGRMAVTKSALAGNTAGERGGAIYVASRQPNLNEGETVLLRPLHWLRLRNSVVENNRAERGGGIYFSDNLQDNFATLVDNGDYYTVDEDRISLLKRHDILVIRLSEEANVESVVAELMTESGPLEEWAFVEMIDSTTLRLEGPVFTSPRAIRQAIAAHAGVVWVTPAFYSPLFDATSLVLDEFIVRLKPGATINDFAGDAFANYKRVGGTTDQFVITHPTAFGVELLNYTNSLANHPLLAWAEPNFRSDFILLDHDDSNNQLNRTGTNDSFIYRSIIQDNTAEIDGGGIYHVSDLDIEDTRIQQNSAGRDGAGIYAKQGELNLLKSSVTENVATEEGGGIFSLYGRVFIDNSTFSGNSAVVGGAIANPSHQPSSIVASTITNNQAVVGGGLQNSGGVLILRNTIVAGNEARQADPDLSGSVGSRGYNLIGNVGDALGFKPGRNHDLVGTPDAPIDPLLAPLSDGDDLLPVHVPLPGSPVIDVGIDDDAATDQRGLPRNVDDPETANSNDTDGTDIGAVERQLSS